MRADIAWKMAPMPEANPDGTATARTTARNSVETATRKNVTCTGVMGVLLSSSLMMTWAILHSRGTPRDTRNQGDRLDIRKVPPCQAVECADQNNCQGQFDCGLAPFQEQGLPKDREQRVAWIAMAAFAAPAFSTPERTR